MKISIATEFSDVPLGRMRSDGDATGEQFREEHLVPKLKGATKGDPLIVDLNGAEGYTPSFLEESFGGLVRKGYYTATELQNILQIEAKNGYKMYREVIWDYIRKAIPPDSQS